MQNFVVAIDGPAGSGKSSISKMVASKLGFTHIDTGAMYRAVTLEALRRKIDLEDESKYLFLEDASIIYKNNIIYLNGVDVSKDIRTSIVTQNVSTCCKLAYVRDAMVKYQRESAKYGKVLMDGRDIGTVVLPNANLKIFLTAKPEIRAQRRYDEIIANGVEANYDEILEEIKIRDFKDSNRKIAPLKQADDAVLIDTSALSKEEVTDKIIELIEERLRKMEDFKIENYDLPKDLKVKDSVTGTVIQVEDKVIYLDIHRFTEGIMYLDHYTFDKNISSFKSLVKVGDVIECEVAKVTDDAIYLSRLNQLHEMAFQRVVDACENKDIVEVKITKVIANKGYNVDYLGNSLFLPLSQSTKEFKVGQVVEVKILEANSKTKNAVVSARVVENERFNQAKEAELASINVNDVLTGEVVKIEKYGVFVKFNYNQGLIRLKDLAHVFTKDANEIVKLNDKIEVKVIAKENGKLLLSRKELLDTPFEAYIKTVKVGQTVTGKVVSKLAFGLLIELADHVKGLLHQSEYSHNPNDNYNDYVKIGDEVTCAILAIDEKKEKISLSRKALIDNPWTRVEARNGDIVDVKVVEVLDNGLKVETLGVDGFVPANEILTENQNGNFKDYYNVNDECKAEIIDINKNEWRLKLSIKKVLIKEERKAFEKYLKQDEVTFTLGDVLKDKLK